MDLKMLDAQTQDELDLAVAAFVSARPRLLAIAYRILGTVNEAEDVVQDVWLRWHEADRAAVVSPTAFLATTTTRLALNVAQSARRRRETCVDRWLPEPVDTGLDPQTKAERGEAVELAVRVLLEKLTGNERAVFVLREVFDYPYHQISEILQLQLANTRQIVTRARNRMAAPRRAPVGSAEHHGFLQAFLSAAQAGNLGDLEQLLARGAAA